MKWLITGGCGFVGSNVADHLLEFGHAVGVVDNLSRYGSSNNLEWLRRRASRTRGWTWRSAPGAHSTCWRR